MEFADYLDLLSTSYNSEVENAIEKCIQIIMSDVPVFYNVKEKFEEQYMTCSNDIDYDIFLLKIIDKIVYQKREFYLRPTQKAAVLSAIKNYKPSKGMLQQISTGEGKTLIIAAVSIISAFKGLTINIITSSSVLAKRDVSNTPNGCLNLYKAFGLTADHICYNSARRREKVYSKCNIIYGDLASYQRDYLMDAFYSKDIATSRKFDIIIIDEVDSLLLDNGLNTLYLSHDIAELEMLHPLLINTWNLVNIQLKNGSSCSNEDFFQSVYTTLFPVIKSEKLAEMLSITSNDEAKEFEEILRNNNIIDGDGTILGTRKQVLLQKFKNMENKFTILETHLKRMCMNVEIQKTNNVLCGIAAMIQLGESPLSYDARGFKNLLVRNKITNQFGELIITDIEMLCAKLEGIKNDLNFKKAKFIREFEKVIANLWLDIPEQLHPYVKSHLKDFITNAEIAYNMEEGIAYQVDLIKSSKSSNLRPKIVIIDRDSGVDLPTTQWHKGLHQFLQLKHGLRLTSLSTKAVFISNVSFLKMFECIYGFSGTLGAQAEKEQLMKIYELPSIIMPSSHVKLFYEEHTIVAKTPEIQYEKIFNMIRLRLDEERSVLVVAESLKQVTSLYENVTNFAYGKLSTEEFEPFKKAVVYKRDSDVFQYGDGTIELPPRTIIFATTLAGRGTDIKLSEKLIARGGLHVIIAFLPRNVRIEEQAFGRAARCGEAGTAQLVVCDKNAISNINIMELKWKRNATESQRVKRIYEHYESKIISEENCFAEFSTKYKQLTKNINENKYIRTLLKDLLDQWALWLDSSEYIWLNKEARADAAVKFCKALKINDQDDQPTRPLNILTYAIQKSIDKKFDEAKRSLQHLFKEFPAYSPEAKYYYVFAAAKTAEGKLQYKEAEKLLRESKTGFENRLARFAENINIVESHKITQDHDIFEHDVFLQQQQDLERLTMLIIESIDKFFGQRIETSDFCDEGLCDEGALFFYKHFTNPDFYGTNFPIIDLKIDSSIDKDRLDIYCRHHGLNPIEIIEKLIEIQDNCSVEMINLHRILQIATWEEFWIELGKKKLITNIKKHLFANLSKLLN